MEPSITSHQQVRPDQWKRPFVETVTAKRVPLEKTRKETVEFPEKDESAGELSMTFVGSAPDDYLTAKVINCDLDPAHDDIPFFQRPLKFWPRI